MVAQKQNTNSNLPAEMKKFKEETMNIVMEHISALTAGKALVIPPDYSPENALKSAWLVILETEDKDHHPALEVCTKESVANSLLDMVISALNPMKKQGYFIVYGNKLTWQRSYQGSRALAKRVAKMKDCNAQIIYDGDEFIYEMDGTTGRTKIVKHVQDFSNIDNNNILGGYAVIVMEDGTTDAVVMTMDQIRSSWEMGKGGGTTKAHKNFTDEMARKTLINRACKGLINSSDDGALYEGRDMDQEPLTLESEAKEQTLGAHANKKKLGIPKEIKQDDDYPQMEETSEPTVEAAPEDQDSVKMEITQENREPGF